MIGNQGNRNPLPARLAQVAQYQDRHKGSLQKALGQLEKAMGTCEALLDAPGTAPEITCRVTHALAISAATVLKLVGSLELDARLREVEQELDYAHKPRLVKNRQ